MKLYFVYLKYTDLFLLQQKIITFFFKYMRQAAHATKLPGICCQYIASYDIIFPTEVKVEVKK